VIADTAKAIDALHAIPPDLPRDEWVGNRFIRFGWSGCPDVLGQLKDGRLLGVEVKAQAGRLRPEQALFLARIRAAGGVAFVARDLRDVLREFENNQQESNHAQN
jgi:hypothetical protein